MGGLECCDIRCGASTTRRPWMTTFRCEWPPATRRPSGLRCDRSNGRLAVGSEHDPCAERSRCGASRSASSLRPDDGCATDWSRAGSECSTIATSPISVVCWSRPAAHRMRPWPPAASGPGVGGHGSLARTRRIHLAELARAVLRYGGYRGVIQLRALVPIVDPGAESPPESILRLRWLDRGLPRPRCQVPVPSPYGGTWWLDVGVEEHRFAAEYDGEQFHTDADKEHDEQRRAWLRRAEEWTIVVVRKANLFGRTRTSTNCSARAPAEAGLA